MSSSESKRSKFWYIFRVLFGLMIISIGFSVAVELTLTDEQREERDAKKMPELDTRDAFLQSMDIRFNTIETFDVEIERKSYNFIKLNISVYEPELVLADLNEFEIHEGGYSDWNTSLIGGGDYQLGGKTIFEYHFDKFPGCTLSLEPANIRGTTYDLNLCYENGIKDNKKYSLKFWFESGSKAKSFPIPPEMIISAVSVMAEKQKQEEKLIDEKKEQFEAENPFNNPAK